MNRQGHSLPWQTHAAIVVACGACLAAAPAPAQQTQSNAGATEEVVVTGSYLARPADRPQPIQVIDRTALTEEQHTSIGEVLKDLPSTEGMAVFNNVSETGDAPTTSINLRGLGPRATLPLLNGTRQVIDANSGIGATAAVDIDNLAPSIMIKRVEILTDGASALYGSDAIAGVVNFITRDDFDGVEVSLDGQSVDRASTSDYTLGMLFGSQSDNSSFVAGLEITQRDPLNTNDIYSFQRLESADVSSFGNPPSLQPGAIPTRFPDPLCGSASLGGPPRAGIVAGSRCALLLSLGRGVVGKVKRTNGLVTAKHDFNDKISAKLQMGFSRARQERGTGYGFPIFFPLPVVPASNPGVVAAYNSDPNFCNPAPGQSCLQDYQLWMRVGSPLGQPAVKYNGQDTWRMIGSLDGKIANWTWSATAAYSENDTQLKDADTLRARLDAALNCMGGPEGDLCYNPLANSYLASPGDPNYNDPTVVNWIQGTRSGDGHSTLRTLDFLVTRELGEMAGGQTGLALGIEHRAETLTYDWDPISNAGGFAFNNTPVLDWGGGRDSNAVFAELDMYPTKALEIQLAARNEDYGHGVSSADPKVGILWTPTKKLFVRTSVGTSFRVPDEVATFGQTSTGSNIMLHGQAVESRGLLQGNPSLQPEKGKSWTAGITFDATDNFTLDLNYYDIKFTDIVRAQDGNILFQQDAADGTIDDPRFIINPAAGTNVVADLTATDIIGFRLSYINQDYQDTRGVDFRFAWQFSSGPNAYNVSLQGTKTLQYKLGDNGQIIDAVGYYNTTNFAPPIPAWQGNVRFDWNRGPHFARITVRHIPKLKEDDPTLQGLTQEFPYTTVDLMYRYTSANGFSGSFGILNVADKQDPHASGTGNLTTAFTQIYDPRGRIYNIELTKSFR